MSYDLNTPEGRYAAVEALGPIEYNRLMAEHRRAQVRCLVNGYEIREISSPRFGTLFMIDGTNTAYQTMAIAMEEAAKLTPGGAK